MARFLVAFFSAFIIFGLIFALSGSLAAALLAGIATTILLFFTLCLLEMAHISDEAASKFRRTP
jgi:hypothetical protein